MANSAQSVCALALQRRNKSELGHCALPLATGSSIFFFIVWRLGVGCRY